MSRRPDHLDLSGTHRAPRGPDSAKSRFNIDLPSPRVGEIPPALSPLDAFAQQSRLLAKRFEESHQQGRRISRLDHLEVASEFGRRPTYFRSASSTSHQAHLDSGDGEEGDLDEPPPLPNFAVKSQPPASERPISHYPSLGVTGDENRSNALHRDRSRQPRPAPPMPSADSYFGIQVPRADSPEAYDSKHATASPTVPSLSGSVDSLHSSQPRTNTDDSSKPDHGLLPPSSPPHPTSKKSLVSIRSVMDIADEELQPPRKFSEASQVSRARSPFTPDPHLASRSPSIRSDHSAFQDDFRRPSFNFSRPLSSSGNKDFPQFRQSYAQQQQYDSDSAEAHRDRSPLSQQPEFSSISGATETEHNNYNIPDTSSQSGDELPVEAGQAGAPSYIYAKYSLPRGRVIERSSLGEHNSWGQHQYKWEHPHAGADQFSGESPSASPNPSERRERPFRPALQLQNARSHSADGRGPLTPTRPVHRSTPSSPSVYSHSTDRTIRAHSKNSPSQDIVNMSAEQHLEKGIECHSSGALSKSTYHLRLAARAGHPTGMLLYALACRHGWGMRANQNEGVQWLKKAVDSSSLEMLEIDEGTSSAQRGNTVQEVKSRKAQFALAIYELGMSYMNGWGIPKDRPLAVRCFEVAGNWGDCDALAEAAFCYTQGLGCKKDLKKAAALYRRAADSGMSMAGNSWIYKEKYMDEVAQSPNPSISDKPGKPSRSRARSIFGRKKTSTHV
ncbi:hypothetical protein K461DRAFT_264618 [Myriangium duriaei CBS 260.36]|uniref:Protein DSF2 n=1 Tax=Myriangium duriaei CBS 260.36 TaxID=1168546 RepID=A0A9P4MSQ3_9PEZI|nr:hypothetical protein K461DRAFT_264618 [Myriangium duriaei CBS 260.36]